jgi:integrase
MIITALDTGMRQGEMLALRFGDIDWTRQLIVLRGETTKSSKIRAVPIATTQVFVKNLADRDDEGGAERDEEIEVNSLDDQD